MTCYANARLILPPNAILLNNLTLQSCQCLVIQENITGFQYDSDENSCYIFSNDSLQSNIRVKLNSQVCFVIVNQISTLIPETTTTLPFPPINVSTSVSNSNYYTTETISLTNTAPLTSLSIIATVPKTLGAYGPSSYTTFWSGYTTNVINNTNASMIFIFEIVNGTTIIAGQWSISINFYLNGQVRPTINDTYIIQIRSNQAIYGHF